MRHWVVGGAVIEAGSLTGSSRPERDGLLLVENLRRNGTSDWTTPGGVIESGEAVVDGLAREVLEETGLEVTRWTGPLYEIEAEAPGLGWTLVVEVHRALEATGVLTVGEDPDGIVIGADWVSDADCSDKLCNAHPWVREPLVEWMSQRWESGRRFRYRIDGEALDDLSIVRW